MGGRSDKGKKVGPRTSQAATRTKSQRTGGLTSRRNAATLRRFYDEVFNKGNVELIDELCAPDFVEHEETPGFETTREGVKQFVTTMRTAFPDMAMTVEDVIAAGNKVIARITMSGTHRGEFMGMPASGKSFSVSTIDIVRFKNGKAAEHWGATDTGKMMEQLGAIAAPAATMGEPVARTTQDVWNHHVQSFVARDVAMALEDFTDDSVVMANGEMFKGRKRIGQFFRSLFEELPEGCAFDLTHCTVLEDNVFITWTAESDTVAYDYAADTFVIKDGKITLQTVGSVKRTK